MTIAHAAAFLAIALGSALTVWSQDLSDVIARRTPRTGGRLARFGLRALWVMVGLAVAGAGVVELAFTFRD